MEILAYIYHATVYEKSESIQLTNQYNLKKLVPRGWMPVVGVILSLLSFTTNALALKPGDQGAGVKELQNNLKLVGLYKGQITGYYGELTQAAVSKFQQAQGLQVDGIAGNNTLAALQRRHRIIRKKPRQIAKSRGALSSKTTTDIVRLQKRLKVLGYYNYKITGYYGELTKAAVKKFQKAKKITVDGIAGPKTNALLYNVKKI